MDSAAAEIIEEGSSQEECLINEVEICSRGKSINGKCKRFNQSNDKLILVATLKSVSFWGLSIKDASINLRKLCNVMPFTDLYYLNKLSITHA